MDSTVEKLSGTAQGLWRAAAETPQTWRYKLLLSLVVFFGFAAVPLFAPGSFVLYLLGLSIIFAIIATGLNITNGYIGLVNLAVGGQVAFGAYSCALALLNGTPLLAALLLAAIAGAVVSALIFLAFARLQGFFFGLATLAASEVIRLLIRNADSITNGTRGLRGYGTLTATPQWTYWILLAILAALCLGTWLIAASSLGLQWRAIRDNRVKAAALGMPVLRLQFLGYALSGAMMSFGGALLALQFQFIDPSMASLNTLVQVIVMVAFGGPGTIAGPILGAIVLTVIPELLRAANELRLIIYGATLMIMVLALPGGVVGTLHRVFGARRNGVEADADEQKR
jgi:branched-chain amino acid transport system permease protein